jgi:hypothetical protein
MLALPELPRSPFDLFARARWRKALDLGLAPPDGARFRSALRIAYDTLPDKREWEALAVEDEARFEREYQQELEKKGDQEKFRILSKDAPANDRSDCTPSDQRTDEDDEKLNGSSITPPSFSSRSLDTNCSDLTLESVWKKPRPCKSLLEGGSSLSELAPFVAAILRDKVVSDLMRESDKLKAEAKEHKTQKRRDRIARKAIFMVAAPCEAGPGGAADLIDNISSRGGCPSSIYCWATKYTASSSKQSNDKKVALLQSENRCKFRDLLLAQFYVHGERVGCFAEDASSFSIKVYRSEDSSKKDVAEKKKDGQAEVMFFVTVGKHKYGFSTSCKTSSTAQEMLLELGRADFPVSEDEIDWEQAIDLDFLKRSVKPESRVRFQWAEQQQQQQCVVAESDPSTRSER